MQFLIHNARIMPMTGNIIEQGYVEINTPYITTVEKGRPDNDYIRSFPGRVYDAQGGYLLPGMIDAHCHVGLFDDGIAIEGDDGNEKTDPVSPQLQAVDGIFQDDRGFRDALEHGITSVMTGPGSSNVIGGRFAFLRTSGRTVDEMVRQPLAAMKAAFGENPKRAYGQKDKTPATRMATAAVLRQALVQAGNYRNNRQPHNGSKENKTDFDMRWEAMLPVISGEMIIKFHAHRTDDILTAVRIANEFGLRYTLDHCTEGYLIADILAREYEAGQQPGHGCGSAGKARLEGIITGPLISVRSKPELGRAELENTAALIRVGLPVAIMTDHPVVPIQYLPVCAAIAQRPGLNQEQVLRSITINAARLCDMHKVLGSIEKGKIADLVVFANHPLDVCATPEIVICDGKAAYWRDKNNLPGITLAGES